MNSHFTMQNTCQHRDALLRECSWRNWCVMDVFRELITICDKFPENIRHTPTPPLAFLEQGVAMLSSVLRSQTAIDVNISIMRAFVLMRQMSIGYEELLKRIEELEQSTDAQFSEVYQALTQLLSKPEPKPRKPIGYRTYDE